MSGFSPGSLRHQTYVLVERNMVRDLGGDLYAAAVAARILFRIEGGRDVVEVDGVQWWRASQEALAEEIGISRGQVKRAVSRLIEGGFLRAEKQHLGERQGWDQTLSYSLVERTEVAARPPLVGSDQSAHLPDLTNEHWPDLTNDHRPDLTNEHWPDLTNVHWPDPTNLPSDVEEEDQDNTLLVTDVTETLPGVGSSPSSRPDPEAVSVEEFEAWWALYPRKVAKGNARKAWRTARKKASLDVLMAGVRVFADRSRGKDLQYVCHPSTWLNGERWLDPAERLENGRVAQGHDDHWRNGGTFFPQEWGRG